MPERSPVRFEPVSITHINIYCAHLARSKPFIADIVGITPVYNEPEINASFFSNGYSHHDLALMQCSDKPLIGADGRVQNTMRNARTPGLNHLGFEVQGEAQLIAACRRALADPEAAGLVKCLDHGISHSVYVKDPDENLLEFYCDIVDDWRAFYYEGADSLITRQWNPLAQEELSTIQPRRTSAQMDDAALHPRRFARATLVVSDLARSLDYYREVVGLRILIEDRTSGIALLGGSAGSYDLSLVEAREGERIGLNCFGFAAGGADEDADALAANLHARGVAASVYRSAFKTSLFFNDGDGFRFEYHMTVPVVDGANPPCRADLLSPL